MNMQQPSESKSHPLVLTAEGKAWVWVTVLLVAMGWYKSINLVLLLGYFMFVLLLVNGVLARRQGRRVVVRREPSLPVYAQEDTLAQVTVTNTSTRPATMTIEDRAGDQTLIWLIQGLPGNESAPCMAHRVFTQRGRFATRVRSWSGFPLGLLHYGLQGEAGSALVVLPAPGVADVDGMRRWLHHAMGDGRARKLLRRVTSDQAEVRGVRPFRPGDSIRSVHWRSTARRREMMVREYDVAPALDLILVVEPWLPANPTPQQQEQLEAALSLTVTLARTWIRAYGTTVIVAVAGDPRSVRSASPTETGLRTALEPLASVVGAATHAPLGSQVFGRAISRSVRVLVSSRTASSHANALTSSTGRAFTAVSPADGLSWYQPPKQLK
ncbi:MAG: DUF58 domain-containing protein [Planctomycetes bacterium]|nr:DUF58 domain-containing protein [Planctomycetota bacterium]